MNKRTSSNDTTDQLMSFEEAFTPLAYHLFPDGLTLDGTSTSNSESNLEETWPQSTCRKIVSAKEAQDSLKQLKKLGNCHGFSSSQQDAVLVAACATLPSDNKTHSVVTPLRDGSSRCFRALLKANLPQPNNALLSGFAVTKLVGTLRHPHLDALGKSSILQYLTLLARAGALSEKARKAFSSLYSILFSLVITDANLCADAVRLLQIITRRSHVKLYRAQRLYQFYQHCSPDDRINFAPLGWLLSLYARYDPPGCGRYVVDVPPSRKWMSFPDPVWERTLEKLMGGDPPRKKLKPTTTVDPLLLLEDFRVSTLSASQILQDNPHLMLLLNSSRRPLSNELAHLKTALPFWLHQEWHSTPSNPHPSNANDATEESKPSSNHDDDYEVDDSETSNDNNNSETKGNEPTIERVHNKAKTTQDPSSYSKGRPARTRMVDALAWFATQTSTIPVAAETLLSREMLRTWDGTAEWGTQLCYDILPYYYCDCYRSPTMTSLSFVELRDRILMPLEKLVLYGTPKLSYAILSGTLTTLLAHLATMPGSEPIADGTPPGEHTIHPWMAKRTMIIKEIIHWTDQLLLKGFLSSKRNEFLLQSATVDFYQVVCQEVAQSCRLIVLPSTFLVYRCLLSQSTVIIDRVCQLLVDYKCSFQSLKEQQQAGKGDVEGLDSVPVFNCLVWDFCSVLWRNSLFSSSKDNPTNRSILVRDLSETVRTQIQEQGSMDLAMALSITHGSVFVTHAWDFLRSIEKEQSLSLLDIKGTIKHDYLDYLKEKAGMEGLHAFMAAFIGSVSKREAKRKQRSSQSS